jgi:hypothetical protein
MNSERLIRFVGGENDGTRFIAFRDDLEEKMRCGIVHLSVPDLIDDEQIRLGEDLHFLFNRVVLVRLLQRLDHVMGSDEINGVSLLNRLQRQGNGQMGFPDSRKKGNEIRTFCRKN